MSRIQPTVTVVIPHLKGREMLRRCLEAVLQTRGSDFEILVVDDGSTDGSSEMVGRNFPDVRLVRNKTTLGFAAACNAGIRASQGRYVALLNDDAMVTPGWLAPLVHALESDSSVAAVQPKILSLHDPARFDYSGGAGGEMDIYGYPFVRGRLFETIEEDTGQYDSIRPCFWATGAAVIFRCSALDQVGLFEERFFAHMEEIDLCWRLHWAGYTVLAVPEAVVHHQTAGTLATDSLRKMMLNHRNSLLMLLRNHTLSALLWVLPMRLLLEVATVMWALVKGRPGRAWAVFAGLIGAVCNWSCVVEGRQAVRAVSRISEGVLLHRMHRGSAAVAYYIRGIRRSDILMS